jgi:hypothetical protein
MTIRIGIGIDNGRYGLIDSQASVFYDRVIADGGVVPTGLIGVSATFTAIKTIYGVSDITAAISVFYDAHYLGYKLGTGAGVTLGQACTKLYSACGASGDCVQATLASQPLLLDWNNTDGNYWFSPQINGNWCSAPNITIPTASGFEMDVKVSFTTNDDTNNTSGWFASQDSGSGLNRSIFFGFNGSRLIRVWLGNFTFDATATTQIPTAFSGWLRVNATTIGGNMEVKFYTSTDGIIFTQLGTTITLTGAANCIRTVPIKFHVCGNSGFNATAGKYYRAIFKDANGVVRADFNPSRFNAAVSQTTFTAVTGEVYTINTGTTTTGYKGVLVDRTIVQSDGVDDNLTVASFASTQAYSEYIAHRRLGTGNLVAKATGNSLSNNATNYILNNGVALNFANISLLRQLITTRNNGASSGQAINNGTETTGNAGTNNGTTLVIGGGNFGVNTYIQSILNDGSTVRSAMYNFIKTLNNNSF